MLRNRRAENHASQCTVYKGDLTLRGGQAREEVLLFM